MGRRLRGGRNVSDAPRIVTGIASPACSVRPRSWFLWLPSFVANAWEVALILLLAGFLRFYQITTTEFDEDQAKLYRMAYDAVHHGLLPTTSNAASVGIANPPGVIYLFMPIAALTANPLWGAVLVGIFTTATTLLTYLFTRRYYGRFAGTVAALLYATAAKPLNYARFIWQPNLMPPFVALFMFALFWGVVERRKGWLFPAVLLLGILYQMHPTTLVLAIPLLLAIVLAFGTLRWCDLALALVSLLIVFFPYLVWESFTHFADLRTIFTLAKQHAHIDHQALHFYRIFLSPYDTLPSDPRSIVRMLAPILSWLSAAVPLLTMGGFVTAALLFLQSRAISGETANRAQESSSHTKHVQYVYTTIVAADVTDSNRGRALFARVLQATLRKWIDLRADPYRCGLLMLLIWQIVPLLVLTRHAIDLHAQYFFLFLPGPFILIGLFLAKAVAWFQARGGYCNRLRYGTYTIASLVIIAQLVGSTASVIDTSSGNFDDRGFQPYPYHNDLRSLQHALGEADQLAQQRHINRIYITTDFATQTALRYLAEFMHTSTTLFDASNCLVLPNPANGPAVLLVGPYDGLTNALLGRFATTTLIAQPARLAGPPFRLYIVTPAVTALPPSHNTFTGHLQLLDTSAQRLNANGSSWLVTRWSLLHAAQPSYRTTYSYALTALLNGTSKQSLCTFTAIRAGDQLLSTFKLPQGVSVPSSVAINAQSFMTVPKNPYYGPFHLETDSDQSIARVTLRTRNGGESLTLPDL